MSTKKILISLFLGCVIVAMMAATPALSKKISLFGYKSDASGVKLIVDTEITRLRGEEKFMPLLVWLGHSEKKTLHAGRESFTLIDPEGNLNPLPAHDDLIKNYGGNILSFDHEMARKVEDYGAMDFLSCKFIRKVLFFPNPSSRAIMYDNVELPARSYFRTLLYFPNKAGKSDGIYVLAFEDKNAGDKVSTAFKVDWMK